MKKELEISNYVLKQVLKQGEVIYPLEACGLIIGPKTKNKAIGVFPIKNIQDDLHKKDPVQYPRGAENAYFMDPRGLKVVEKECERYQFETKIIYHSHPDHGAYFSEEDKAMAAPWGEPSYPGTSYLVVSVEKGLAKGASLFFWDDMASDFLERKLKWS